MPERELVCIVCPNGCALKIRLDDSGAVVDVTGNKCARGKTYAETEMTNPVRTLTALVQVENGEFARCPVRSDRPVAKKDVAVLAAKALKMKIKAPVKIGDVIARNIDGAGADLIATRSIEAAS